MPRYTDDGQEILDTTPVALPAHFKRPPSLQQRIQAFVRTELSRQAMEQGAETFEEANDFDVDDEEPLPLAGAELTMMEIERGFRDADQAVLDAAKGTPPTPPPTPPAKPPVEPAAAAEAPAAGG